MQVSVPQNGPVPYDNYKRYHFGCCHIRNWAIRIGIFQIVSILLNVASSFLGRNPFRSTAYYAVSFSVAIICIVIISLMIHGVKKERSGMVIPNLVLQILIIIGCIIGSVLMFMAIPELNKIKAEETDKAEADLDDTAISLAYGMGIAFIIGLIFQIFFTYVYFRCYRYLVEIKFVNNSAVSAPVPNNYPAVELGISSAAYSVTSSGNPPGYPSGYPSAYPPAYPSLSPPTYIAEPNVEKQMHHI